MAWRTPKEWARESGHQWFPLTGQEVMAGGEKTSREKTDSDKSRKILWKRRYFQMQEESNKEILQKRSDGCMMGPKVKALYTEREVRKVDKQSADDRKHSQNCHCFSKSWRSLLWQFLRCFLSRSPHREKVSSKGEGKYHLGSQWLLVSACRMVICFNAVLLILPPHVKRLFFDCLCASSSPLEKLNFLNLISTLVA